MKSQNVETVGQATTDQVRVEDDPALTQSSGRDRAGRFAKGNPGGPGNPHARRAQELRTAFFAAVSDEDLRAVVLALVREAKGGDVAAARELLERCLGKAEAADLQDRLVELERLFQAAGAEAP